MAYNKTFFEGFSKRDARARSCFLLILLLCPFFFLFKFIFTISETPEHVRQLSRGRAAKAHLLIDASPAGSFTRAVLKDFRSFYLFSCYYFAAIRSTHILWIHLISANICRVWKGFLLDSRHECRNELPFQSRPLLLKDVLKIRTWQKCMYANSFERGGQ